MESKETSSFAVNLDVEPQKFNNCSFCSKDSGQDADHPIFKCQVYGSPEAKIEILKLLNGCFKCACLKHFSSQCRFRFKRKCACKQWHFSYLCTKKFRNLRSQFLIMVLLVVRTLKLSQVQILVRKSKTKVMLNLMKPLPTRLL